MVHHLREEWKEEVLHLASVVRGRDGHHLRKEGKEEGTEGKQSWKGSLVGKPNLRLVFKVFSFFFPSPLLFLALLPPILSLL